MSRRCGEPVDVRRRDEAPSEFVWRARLYLVRAVLAHWVEAGSWWRAAAGVLLAADAETAPPAGPALDPVLVLVPAAPRWGQRAWGEPAPDLGTVAAGAVDDREREFWRVEAGCGRVVDTGVYDLCFDWSAGSWTIARVLD
ncbi:MAG TPA: DUF6504 family protein [Mycobacteriales bacterium]|nr:DUF6504 family protein [Mycobacteriales bacterium]